MTTGNPQGFGKVGVRSWALGQPSGALGQPSGPFQALVFGELWPWMGSVSAAQVAR